MAQFNQMIDEALPPCPPGMVDEFVNLPWAQH